MFKSTTARETSIERRGAGGRKKEEEGVGGKTLHGERGGDRCRRVTGTFEMEEDAERGEASRDSEGEREAERKKDKVTYLDNV